MKIDSPSKLRSLAQKRDDQAITTQALRIPMVMDQDAADAAEAAQQQRAAIADQIRFAEERWAKAHSQLSADVADLEEALAIRDESETSDPADVRGNGLDTTGLGQELRQAREALATAKAEREAEQDTLAEELRRTVAAADKAVEVARAGIIHLVFSRVESDEYERLLMRHGGSDMTTPEKERPFLDDLLASAFLRVEYADGSTEELSWVKTVEILKPSQGELGAWRTMNFAHQARSGVGTPFASKLFGRTRTS